MKKVLKLQEVTDVLNKVADDRREYVRVTFNALTIDKELIEVRFSMSETQWKTLKTVMGISLNKETEKIETNIPVTIEFDPEGKTKSKNPKPLSEFKEGTWKGYSYNYFELNVGILIENGIVNKEEFKKDYGKLF